MSISEEREKRQAKVFMKWVNSHLKRVKREIKNLEEDFDDGVNLCLLYEVLAGEKLKKKYNPNPKSQIQRTNNLAVVCEPINAFVKEVGIGLQYSPTQIEKGDARQILGLLWILITKFVIPESEEEVSRKKALLKWVQKVTEPYDNVDVKDFHKSWQDGLAFNALLHQFDNELLDYSKLDKSDPNGNCKQAFDIAEKELDITRLLDEEDVVDVEKPDEKSVMMYVALYYQAFHKNLGRKLKQLADKFLLDVSKLLKWIEEKSEKYSDTKFECTKEEAYQLQDELKTFLQGEKKTYGTYKCSLYVNLSTIQFSQKKERLAIFIPDDDHSLTGVQKKWMKLNDILVTYGVELNNYINSLEEEERRKEEEALKKQEDDEMAEQERLRKEMEDLVDEQTEQKKKSEEELAAAKDERKKVEEELERIKKELEDKIAEQELKEKDLQEKIGEQEKSLDELDQRKKEQEETNAKIDEERKNRREEKEKRDKEWEEKKAKLEEDRKKLGEYDQKASGLMNLVYDKQSELTHCDPLDDDADLAELDQETDEETKNKRVEAVKDVEEKAPPILDDYENLGEIKDYASIPKHEVDYSIAGFKYSMQGEDSEILSEIRKFKLEEPKEE